MRIVGGEEGGDGALGVREGGHLGPLEARLAEDGEPGFDEGEPRGMDRQPVEREPAWPVVQVERDLRRGVHPDGIEDEVDHLPFRRLPIKAVKEFEELGAAVAVAHDPDHLAGVHAEGSQDRRGAVADILEFAARGAVGGDGLARRGGSAHPDPGFLIDAEGRAVGRRVEFEFNDGDRFFGKVGVAFGHPGVKDGPGGHCAPGG